MAKRSKGRAPWRSPIFWFALAIPTVLVLYAALLFSILPESRGDEMSYTSFIRRLERRDVAAPLLLNEDRRVLFKSGGKEYWATLPTDPTRERFLNSAVDQDLRVQVDQQTLKRIILPATQYLVPSLFIGCILVLTFLLTRADKGGTKEITRRKSKGESVTFADVAGSEEAVAEVREVRDYLMHPERLAEIGAQPPAASCWSVLRGPGRRCWLEPSPERPEYRSSPPPAPSSWRCTRASGLLVSGSCSERFARAHRPFSSSTSWTPRDAPAPPTPAAVRRRGTRP